MLFGRSALRLLSGVSERQLVLWEHERWIEPIDYDDAEEADEPLYDATALRRVCLIRTLAEELEVNLPGIDVILHLLERFERDDEE
jgi:DNA-binding transcriptional MerR regulator